MHLAYKGVMQSSFGKRTTSFRVDGSSAAD
jgi:hypothetical protein